MDLQSFLELAPTIDTTARGARMLENRRYFEGRQYDGRTFDMDGNFAGSSLRGSAGAGRAPSWKERRIACVRNLSRVVSRRLTRWALGGSNWCRLEVVDDDAAEDFLREASRVALLPSVAIEARDYCGGLGSGCMSLRWTDGLPVVEAHDTSRTWVLSWADEQALVPASVAKLYEVENPFAAQGAAKLLEVRYWDAAREVVYRRVEAPDKKAGWIWDLRLEVAHGLGRCPVIWWKNSDTCGQDDGSPDIPKSARGLIDEVNEQLCAGSITTKRNADDTLIVKEHPNLNPGDVRKGSFHAIFARGGAEYLSQSGDSARICKEMADDATEDLYQEVGVIMVDLDTLGKAASGEALKRIFTDQNVTTDEIRVRTAHYAIVPMAQMILETARKLGNTRLAARVTPAPKDGTLGVVVQPRVPGKSSSVTCVWPDPFPATTQDKLQGVQAAAAGVGGGVMSLETAIALQQDAGVPISDPEREEEAIEEHATAQADRQAKALGLQEPPAGNAGPVDTDNEKDEETAA